MQNDTIEDTKPVFADIAHTKAVATVGSITYNETGVTYNQSGLQYGGIDPLVDLGPQLELVEDGYPKNYDVINL